jgi:hypothetical protein
VTIPSRGVQMTVDGWNKAMYALWVDRAGSETAVNSSLTTYDMPESFVKDFDTRMRAEIDRIGGLVAA